MNSEPENRNSKWKIACGQINQTLMHLLNSDNKLHKT